MTEDDAITKYMRWRKTAPCQLSKLFDKWVEGQPWMEACPGESWGRYSTCGNYRMIVMKSKIRLIEKSAENK